ncbi:MAG: Flp family type IVb pilin [Aeromicrobium erythreum]
MDVERRAETGATAVEYALIVGLVSLVVVAAVVGLVPPFKDFVAGISFFP